MTPPQQIDPERLAALLDGRLSPAEAAVVRQQLAIADDDTLSAYADAIAVSAELADASDRGAVVIPIEKARRKRQWAMAAVAAAAAVLAIFLYGPAQRAPGNLPAQYALALSDGAKPGDQAWSMMRGTNDGMLEPARSVRIGALLIDLELGAKRRDTSKAHAIELVKLLGNDGDGPVRAFVQNVAAEKGALDKQKVHEIGRQVLARVDRQRANAGAYLEAARIALRNEDTRFLDEVLPTPLLRLKGDTILNERAKSALLDLERDMNRRPRDTQALEGQMTTLLQILAQ